AGQVVADEEGVVGGEDLLEGIEGRLEVRWPVGPLDERALAGERLEERGLESAGRQRRRTDRRGLSAAGQRGKKGPGAEQRCSTGEVLQELPPGPHVHLPARRDALQSGARVLPGAVGVKRQNVALATTCDPSGRCRDASPLSAARGARARSTGRAGRWRRRRRGRRPEPPRAPPPSAGLRGARPRRRARAVPRSPRPPAPPETAPGAR